ncbi:MAG: xylose isomerase, partial [Clostridiaceae bacterium]
MAYFSEIGTIRYEGAKSANPFSFKYYNPDELVAGKPMKEHLRFAMSWWHTFTYRGVDPFGGVTIFRPWDETENDVERAKERVHAAFEFMEKMQIGFFCFHDADLAPRRDTLLETNRILDEVVAVVKQEMARTGIKCL